MIETLLTIILLPVAAVAAVITVCLAIGLIKAGIDGFKKWGNLLKKFLATLVQRAHLKNHIECRGKLTAIKFNSLGGGLPPPFSFKESVATDERKETNGKWFKTNSF